MPTGLPGVQDLRLQPRERTGPGDAAGQRSAEASTRDQMQESTVSFKDLATLVAVVLDRSDDIGQHGSGYCERNQAAATSSWPTDVARNVPPFTPTSEPEHSPGYSWATDEGGQDVSNKKKRRRSNEDDRFAASVSSKSPATRTLAVQQPSSTQASAGLSGGRAHLTPRTAAPISSFSGGSLPSSARAGGSSTLQAGNTWQGATKQTSSVSSGGARTPAADKQSKSPRANEKIVDYLPMQCPVRKSQGKWVLNVNCSCNGGKKKLQAPVHATRVGSVAKFKCTHSHCRSFHGGICPHFQMCPHCLTLRSINSMSNGECRAGKGCRRQDDPAGKDTKPAKSAARSRARASVSEELPRSGKA